MAIVLAYSLTFIILHTMNRLSGCYIYEKTISNKFAGLRQ